MTNQQMVDKQLQSVDDIFFLIRKEIQFWIIKYSRNTSLKTFYTFFKEEPLFTLLFYKTDLNQGGCSWYLFFFISLNFFFLKTVILVQKYTLFLCMIIKFWHQAIFPKGLPLSIVTPKTFNYQIRDGLVWIRISKDTKIFNILFPISLYRRKI